MQLDYKNYQKNPEYKQIAKFINDFLYFSCSDDYKTQNREDIDSIIAGRIKEAHTVYLWREDTENCDDLPTLASKIDSLDVHDCLFVMHTKNVELLSPKLFDDILEKVEEKMPSIAENIDVVPTPFYKEPNVSRQEKEHLNGIAFVLVFKDAPLLPPKNDNTIILTLHNLYKQT